MTRVFGLMCAVRLLQRLRYELFFVIRSTDEEEYVRGDGLLLPHSTPSYVIILTVNEKSFIACRSLLCRYYTQQQEQKPKQKLSKKKGSVVAPDDPYPPPLSH